MGQSGLARGGRDGREDEDGPAEQPAMRRILFVLLIVSHFLPVLSYIGPFCNQRG